MAKVPPTGSPVVKHLGKNPHIPLLRSTKFLLMEKFIVAEAIDPSTEQSIRGTLVVQGP